MDPKQRERIDESALQTRERFALVEPDAASILLPRNLISWRLAALVVAVRRSAASAYMRVTGLSDGDSRAIRHLGVHGCLVLTELAALLCKDKAQVSRIVKRLIQTGVASRPHLRAAIRLTVAGQAIYERVLNLSRTRNATLIHRLSGDDLTEFRRLIACIDGNARRCLDARAPQASDAIRRAAISARLTQALEARAHEPNSLAQLRLILPDLTKLLDLLDASADSAYSRVSGLTDFEWRLLGLVALRATLTLIELVQLLDRDKSQVGRAVRRLTAEDILRAEKIGGGRHVMLSMTPKGTLINDRLFRVAKERNALLASGLSIRELRTLIDCFDKLNDGAAELMAAEESLTS